MVSVNTLYERKEDTMEGHTHIIQLSAPNIEVKAKELYPAGDSSTPNKFVVQCPDCGTEVLEFKGQVKEVFHIPGSGLDKIRKGLEEQKPNP